MTDTWTQEAALFRLTVSDLAATPPVSPEEERRLLEVMAAGQKAAERLAEDIPLGTKERAELEQVRDEGTASRRRLIQTNGRLVISIAMQYLGQGSTLAELSQEGVLGLIRAIDKFDVERGNRLSTYATYWIRQNITRALAAHTRTIRLPIQKVEKLKKIKKTMGKLTQDLGRPPEIEEVAAAIDEPPQRIRQLLKYGQETVSLEEPVGDDGATLVDFVGNDYLQAVEDQVDAVILEEKIRTALSELTARECRIVELRFGLRNGSPLTLRDIADRFGLTRERIRQLEQQALAKLRDPGLATHLADFVN